MESVIHNIDKAYALEGCKYTTLKAQVIGNVRSEYGPIFSIGLSIDNNMIHILTISINGTFNCQTSVFGGIQGCASFIRTVYPKHNWRYGGHVVLNMILSVLFKSNAETKTQFIIDYLDNYKDEITAMFDVISSGGDYKSTNGSDMHVGVIILPVDSITDEDVSYVFEQLHQDDIDDYDDSDYDDEEDDEE